MSDFGFRTPEQLEVVFETDRPFAEEQVAESLGRQAWLRIRGGAELLLYLAEMNAPLDLLANMFRAHDYIGIDHYDFLLTGLGADRNTPREAHPDEAALYDLIEELIDRIDADAGFQVEDRMSDLAQLSNEEIAHRLQGLKDSIPDLSGEAE